MINKNFLLALIIFEIAAKVQSHQQPLTFSFPENFGIRECQFTNSNQYGICTKLTQCFSAQIDFNRRRIQPTICWFDQYEPVVCCKNDIIRTTISPIEETTAKINDKLDQLRISEKECQKEYDENKQFFGISAVGGTPTKPGEFPFMVALGWSRFDNEIDFKCGGFLISPNFVITAAHCARIGGIGPAFARIGGDNLTLENPNIAIERVWQHPQYNSRQVYNDIAVIKLAQSVNQKPACLHTVKDIPINDVTAIGYGHTQFAGKSSDQLLKVSLKVLRNENCSQYYPPSSEFNKGIINSQICAGDPDSKQDTCQGDSGGPLFYITLSKIPYIIGLTSFGEGCASGPPSVYTRSSSFADWIESIVWSKE